MQVYAYEFTIGKKGTLTLQNLPFNVGERIDVIIIPHSSRQPEEERYPFWGKPITYVNPTDPVAEEDIVALAGAWADMPLAEELRQDLGQDAPREQC